jgi:hypothetical protein
MLCDRPRTMAPMISDAEVLAAYRAEVRYPGNLHPSLGIK